MRFENTDALFLLIACGLLFVLYWWGIKRKKRDIARFGELDLTLKNRAGVSFGRQLGKGSMVTFAAILITLATARFQCGTHLEAVKTEGVDIMIAVDVSSSMLAEDLKPNRLSRAVQEVRGLIDSLRGDRIGLVAFAGDAFVQCPLTVDYSAASLFLTAFNTGLIAQQGTAIGEAIRVATKAFDPEDDKHKALILLTDGEDHDTDPLGAAKEAAEQGITIYPIGIGSVQGEPIPVYGANGERVGFVKDDDGKVVMSRLGETTLREIVRITDGKYYRATPGGFELEQILADIRGMDKKELGGQLVTQYADRYQWPLMLGLLLLLIEFIIPERPGGLWYRIVGRRKERNPEEITNGPKVEHVES